METTTDTKSMTTDEMLLIRSMNLLIEVAGRGDVPREIKDAANNLWGDLYRRFTS